MHKFQLTRMLRCALLDARGNCRSMKPRQLFRRLRVKRPKAGHTNAAAAPEVKLAPAGSALEQVTAQQALNSLAYGAYVTDGRRKIVFWSDAAASGMKTAR